MLGVGETAGLFKSPCYIAWLVTCCCRLEWGLWTQLIGQNPELHSSLWGKSLRWKSCWARHTVLQPSYSQALRAGSPATPASRVSSAILPRWRTGTTFLPSWAQASFLTFCRWQGVRIGERILLLTMLLHSRQVAMPSLLCSCLSFISFSSISLSLTYSL